MQQLYAILQICHNSLNPHRRCNDQRARLECSRSRFESEWVEIEDYNIGICRFSAKHASLRRKGEDWLARNQDNVSEWGGMYIPGLLFQ